METITEDLTRLPKEGYGFIYRYRFDNGKCYIGQTTNSIKKRHDGHCSKNSRTIVDKIICAKNHAYVIDMLCEVPIEELDSKEVEYILQCGSLYPKGYNQVLGGQTRREYSEETRRKLSVQKRKFFKEHPEVGASISERTKQRMSDPQVRKQAGEMLWKYHLEHGDFVKVLCLETGEVFDTILQAEKRYAHRKVNEQTIGKVVRGERDTSGGLHWIRYEEHYLDYTEEILHCLKEWQKTKSELHRKKCSEHLTKVRLIKNRPIICLETKKVYHTIKEASREYGCSTTVLLGVLEGAQNTVKGKHWIDYTPERMEYTDEILECLKEWEATKREYYAKRSRKYLESARQLPHPRAVKVRCIENDEVYGSIYEASQSLGISSSAVWRSMNHGRATASGLHLIRV